MGFRWKVEPVVATIVHNIYIDIKFAIEFCSSSIKANKESGINVRIPWDKANTDSTVVISAQ